MLKKNLRRKSSTTRRSQKGQVLVIVVFAITALVAFVGLVVDLGLVFIQYGRLRRAVDSAALAASLQYREGYTIDSLESAAVEFLNLNGIDDPSAVVTVCDYDNDLDSDAPGEELALCDANGNGDNDGVIEPDNGELRKFVHVIAGSNVQLAFLPVIGINNVSLGAEAVSEAASLDVVLVIDRSESMTNGSADFPVPPFTKERDPRYCNAVIVEAGWQGDCHSFHEVKKAAYEFVRDNLFFPYDRVGIITFDENVHTGDDESNPGLHLISDRDTILTRIKQLTVYDPSEAPAGDAAVLLNYETVAHLGGCEFYSGGGEPCRGYVQQNETDYMFQQFFCQDIGIEDCTTSNIGGALLEAGTEFAIEGNSRPEALWVVIVIADGLANSSVDIANDNQQNIHCPNSTHTAPYCNDGDPGARHCLNNAPENAYCIAQGGVVDVVPDDGVNDYDADDFGRDMADFVGVGQQALVFTIGLSDLVQNCTSCAVPDTGEQFLKYVAEVGNGRYFHAPNGDDLRDIFREIADNIAVRLTH